MSFQCKVGPLLEDVVPFVRNQIEDLSGVDLLDSAFSTSVSQITRDLSRFYPLTNVVGDVAAGTSPLQTVQRVQRYRCTSSNGFTGTIRRITDVLYRASGGFNASSEIGYLALLPFSPANTFAFSPSIVSSPSRRIIRDEMLGELDHYGVGQTDFGSAGVLLDNTGAFCIDLFPVPNTTGLPIYVRYHSMHVVTIDSNGNASIPTLPDDAVRYFQLLLKATILRQLVRRASGQQMAEAGMIKVQQNSMMFRTLARDAEEQAYTEMGVSTGAGETSF